MTGSGFGLWIVTSEDKDYNLWTCRTLICHTSYTFLQPKYHTLTKKLACPTQTSGHNPEISESVGYVLFQLKLQSPVLLKFVGCTLGSWIAWGYCIPNEKQVSLPLSQASRKLRKLNNWFSVLKFSALGALSRRVARNHFERSLIWSPLNKFLLHSALAKQLACNKSQQCWKLRVFFNKLA